MQTKHVVVVKGKGFRLLAWDARDRSKSLCILVKSGKHSSSVCAQKLNAQTGLQFASLQDSKQTFSLVGGAAKKSVTKVVATFADGKQLTMRTKPGKRYKGRRHGHVKFWAGRHRGPAPLRTLAAKTASGATLQMVTVSPSPQPVPPQPCPPCSGPPRAQSGARIVCPLCPA